MFVQLENETLVNTDLMDRVEPVHHKKIATAYAGGIILHADSHLLYQHFFGGTKNEPISVPMAARRNPDGSWVKE